MCDGSARGQNGNVAILAAILILPVILVMGGALDVVRATTLRVSMQQALDAAVLAAAPLNQSRQAEEAVEDFFFRNVANVIADEQDVDLEINATIELSGKSVSGVASYAYDTVFLKLIGVDTLDVVVESGGKQQSQETEISLVLDVSGSMGSSGKMLKLITAAHEFVDIILTDDVKEITTLNVVPFATHVNVGDDFLSYVDPTKIDLLKNNNYVNGHRWIGCLDMHADDYELEAFPTASLSPLPEFQIYRTCPEINNQAIFASNNALLLKARITAMAPEICPACYTSIDEGTAIGLKALNPDMRGAFSGSFRTTVPRDYDSGTLKAIVIMTDGNMVKFYRATNCWHYSYSCVTTPVDEDDAEQAVLDMCEEARENNIIVFTVGFQIAPGSSADQLLAECAGDDLHYFLVEDDNLSEAFSQIAGFIKAVRLIG